MMTDSLPSNLPVKEFARAAIEANEYFSLHYDFVVLFVNPGSHEYVARSSSAPFSEEKIPLTVVTQSTKPPLRIGYGERTHLLIIQLEESQ